MTEILCMRSYPVTCPCSCILIIKQHQQQSWMSRFETRVNKSKKYLDRIMCSGHGHHLPVLRRYLRSNPTSVWTSQKVKIDCISS